MWGVMTSCFYEKSCQINIKYHSLGRCRFAIRVHPRLKLRKSPKGHMSRAGSNVGLSISIRCMDNASNGAESNDIVYCFALSINDRRKLYRTCLVIKKKMWAATI